jgi:hypothetical protein
MTDLALTSLVTHHTELTDRIHTTQGEHHQMESDLASPDDQAD